MGQSPNLIVLIFTLEIRTNVGVGTSNVIKAMQASVNDMKARLLVGADSQYVRKRVKFHAEGRKIGERRSRVPFAATVAGYRTIILGRTRRKVPRWEIIDYKRDVMISEHRMKPRTIDQPQAARRVVLTTI